MIKLFTDEGWPNFSEEDGILSTGAPIILFGAGAAPARRMEHLSMCTRRERSFYICAALRSKRS